MHLHTEVRELHGDGGLEAITVEHTGSGEHQRLGARALFVFIGAEPCTGWLAGALATDDDGFLITGGDLEVTHLDPAGDGRERAPLPLETEPPGRLRRRATPAPDRSSESRQPSARARWPCA